MGLPLLDWVFTREETTEAECSRYLVQVIAALQYLHSSHVAYLDLKVNKTLIILLYSILYYIVCCSTVVN